MGQLTTLKSTPADSFAAQTQAEAALLWEAINRVTHQSEIKSTKFELN
jgi:hypothetical protein